ncbi:3650_t:CDS:2 [Ambispora gerdemannii]|uniref:3650_t:CDS:1 n=1 Tax=Ambispora gerdemannii TaxID=144530 RepID=A0A9N9G3J7_9GLOM|nr:3650_t:CDS:2 [Ambispora gerdemannii]
MSSPFIVPDCTQQVSGRIADSEIVVPSSEQLLERLAHGKLGVPNCSEQLFEKIAFANPHLRMNLIEGQLEIMSVLEETNTREAWLIWQVGNWCNANGHFGGFNASIIVPNARDDFDILGPDACVMERLPDDPENQIFRKLTKHYHRAMFTEKLSSRRG